MTRLRLFLSLLIVCTMCRGRANDDRIGHIVQDRSFTGGISVLGNSSAQPQPIATIHPFGEKGQAPAWSIAQWGSKHVMKDALPLLKEDTVIYQNESKRIYFYHDDREENGFIGLEVFASNEYGEPRKEGDDWTHLLLEQGFSNPVSLQKIEKLTYRIKSKLLFCENKMGEQYNPGLHTAQITLFLTIQNRNEQSPSFGDFFWFGLPLYDYRYPDIPQYAQQDLGKDDASKKFIFTVASHELFDTSMHDHEWISIHKDIYPSIRDAFETCQERGYMTNTGFDELCITSMNIGWEVPGTFDCGIVFECPSLIAALATNN